MRTMAGPSKIRRAGQAAPHHHAEPPRASSSVLGQVAQDLFHQLPSRALSGSPGDGVAKTRAVGTAGRVRRSICLDFVDRLLDAEAVLRVLNRAPTTNLPKAKH